MAQSSPVNNNPLTAPVWLLIVEGVLAIAIGFFFLLQPVKTLLAIGVLLAVFWLIHGLNTLVSLIWNRESWGWKVFVGGLGVIIGVSILMAPLTGAAALSIALVILLGAYGLIAGIIEIYMGIDRREAGTVVIGALTFIFGFVFMLYPVIGLAVIPWILGTISIVTGVLSLWLAFTLRRNYRQLESY